MTLSTQTKWAVGSALVVLAGIAAVLVGGELAVPLVAELGGAAAMGAGIACVIQGPATGGSGKNMSSQSQAEHQKTVPVLHS